MLGWHDDWSDRFPDRPKIPFCQSVIVSCSRTPPVEWRRAGTRRITYIIERAHLLLAGRHPVLVHIKPYLASNPLGNRGMGWLFLLGSCFHSAMIASFRRSCQGGVDSVLDDCDPSRQPEPTLFPPVSRATVSNARRVGTCQSSLRAAGFIASEPILVWYSFEFRIRNILISHMATRMLVLVHVAVMANAPR